MFILRFPQLAVSAKLLCLLMVICGAVPSMVRSVELYSDYSGKFVVVNDIGRVSAENKQSSKANYYNLTIVLTEDFAKLTIYSPQTGRYICFNQNWRPKGVIKPKSMKRCWFIEEINSNGFTTFQSYANKTHFLAFSKKGRPLKTQNPFPATLNFLKLGTDFNISKHNELVSGKSRDETHHKVRHSKRHQHRLN